MDFTGFTLYPSAARTKITTAAEQREVGEILEHDRLIEHLPRHKMLRIELENEVVSGTSLVKAHGSWKETYFQTIQTPPGLPRQPFDAVCPAGIVKVAVACIDRHTPGMGSHFGFKGYYLSVLVSLLEQRIWDARGQPAT
jgi:hypothetical protein